MKNISWFYPENTKEAVELLQSQDVLLHGGGTHLSGKKLSGYHKLVALHKLPLSYIIQEKGFIRIGSMTDYHTIAEKLKQLSPGHILSKSLSRAATTPIRNRITIGGSLYLAPNWSDLTGPLLALDAEVELEGPTAGVYSVEDYLVNRELKEKTLITEIIIPDMSRESWYYRETRTENDQPAFTISILVQKEKALINDVAIAITGHTGRFMRAGTIEDRLRNRPLGQIDLEGIANSLDIKFAAPHHGSSGYLQHTLAVQLERGLTELLKL
ncbi:MAG: FAD binding domain-containing protein [Bacteroidales bacterium]|nr:FAD binding domain-containing protein [Bacteroidales bacterium]